MKRILKTSLWSQTRTLLLGRERNSKLRDMMCMVMVMMGVDEMVRMGRCMMVTVNEMARMLRDSVQQGQKRDMMCMVMEGRWMDKMDSMVGCMGMNVNKMACILVQQGQMRVMTASMVICMMMVREEDEMVSMCMMNVEVYMNVYLVECMVMDLQVYMRDAKKMKG